ncbi:aminopeptidase P family protein [Streptomyces pactum]|uniref:Aminopeptidase P family protein n=1 Tax=Streptomyces pactum TaxID=68249 RepID=A0ABS0NE79_9ACTN|nr:M24 family metallopeptidase [Streptomyces pactum]MBH5333475.1 aminopeptidase P family protein [Streptomyces pactum]
MSPRTPAAPARRARSAALPAFPFDGRDLDRFREVQRLAYRCAERVAGWLEPGVTERQAAARLRRELVAEGVRDFFHVPFAWFGDRTAFRRFRTPLQFFPTGRRLTDGMAYVLDCAPVVDGYTADIGYAGKIGDNPVWDRIAADLPEYRALILRQVRERRTLAEVYRAVDGLIERHGYDNRHRVYPGRVIGHQVTRTTARGPAGATVFGFGVRTLQTLGRELIGERLHGRSPLWADGRASRHAPTPGLWAVEPHVAFRDVGLKFEELLVVTEDDAHWLDDDVPHLRRVRRAG